MPKTKKERLTMAAPKFQWSFDTARLFKHLSPDGKDNVFRQYYKWLDQARKRGAQYYIISPDLDGLNEMEVDCLSSMIDNTCEGFDSYWSHCKPQNQLDTLVQFETVSDCTSQAVADNKINNKISNEIKEESMRESPPTSSNQVIIFANSENLRSDIAEKFFHYYSAIGWKDGNGNSITDWHAKYRVWANKEPTPPLLPIDTSFEEENNLC